jgi:hypothetical protein
MPSSDRVVECVSGGQGVLGFGAGRSSQHCQIKLVAEFVQHRPTKLDGQNYIQTGQVRRVHNVVKRLTSNRLEVDQFQILKTTGA